MTHHAILYYKDTPIHLGFSYFSCLRFVIVWFPFCAALFGIRKICHVFGFSVKADPRPFIMPCAVFAFLFHQSFASSMAICLYSSRWSLIAGRKNGLGFIPRVKWYFPFWSRHTHGVCRPSPFSAKMPVPSST